jgi:tetratricopeptide (TPR) repeat protein
MLFGMARLVALLLVSALAIGQTRPDVRSIVLRGQGLAEAGQLAEAQQLYESAVRDLPDNSDLRFELGTVYLRERNWAKAIENYQRSLSANPNRVKALFYLAEAYSMNSDLSQACETLARAVDLAPDDAQIRQKYGEYLSAKLESRSEGLRQLQKARQVNPNLPRIDFDIGKVQFDLTDYPSATDSFEAELKKIAGDGEASFFLAESSARLGSWEKARRYYEYALAHGYADAATYYGLGRAFVELDDFAPSLAPLQRALALRPSLIQAHFQLGRAYQRLGRLEEAGHENKLYAAMSGRIDTSSELRSPELEEAWKHVKPLLADNKEQEALEYLAKLPNLDPASPGNSHYVLGEMYFTLGRNDDARRVLLTASKLSPNDAQIAAYLGMMQLASGEISAGEQSLHSALTLDAANPLALIGMGGIRYRQQRWQDAIEYLERSRTAAPDSLFMLCNAYLRVGKREDALLTAEVIRALGADQQTLLDSVDQLLKGYPSSEPHSEH